MINAEYKEPIERKSRLLQNYIGLPISDKIRLNGFKVDTDGTIDDKHSTPIQWHFDTSPISAETTGDDSTEAWIEADGPKAVVDFADRIGFLDGTSKISA